MISGSGKIFYRILIKFVLTNLGTKGHHVTLTTDFMV